MKAVAHQNLTGILLRVLCSMPLSSFWEIGVVDAVVLRPIFAYENLMLMMLFNFEKHGLQKARLPVKVSYNIFLLFSHVEQIWLNSRIPTVWEPFYCCGTLL